MKISAVKIQKTAGLHDAAVGYEAETGSAKASSGDGIESVCIEIDRFPLGFCALTQNTVVVRCTGGFELK